MKNPGIKIPYLRIDHPVVEETRCVEIRIPDDDSFMPVLAGLVAIATKWFNYERDDTHKGAELGRIWRNAYVLTDWSGCMNCEELTACILPLLNNQTEQILELIQNINNYGTENPGQPLTELELTENIAGTTNPTCDQDILWAQCLAIVQYTNLAITNVLERIEVAANSAELLELLDGVPFLNFITTQLGVSGAGAVANYFQEAVAEGYFAQYDEAVEEELACALFCLFRDNCTITIADVYNYFTSRVSALIPDNPSDLIELVEIVAGLDFDGTEVVDVMFWFAWAGTAVAQFVVGKVTSVNILQKLLALAVDDASADWIILCTDCPPECLTWNRGNPSTWDFPDSVEADIPLWRQVEAGQNMTGSIDGLNLPGFEQCTFMFKLDPIDVVTYNYIRVITNVGTYSYSGSFTGTSPYNLAIIPIPPGEFVQTCEFQIVGTTAASPYELVSVELCP